MTSIQFLLEALTISQQATPEIVAGAERLRQLEIELAKQQGIQEGIKIMKSLINPNNEQQ
jgi:sugar (pentulose or hexulose) kinase